MNQLQDIPHKQDLDRAIGVIVAGADSFQDEKRDYREAAVIALFVLAALEIAAGRAVLAIEERHGVKSFAHTMEEEVRCMRYFFREVCATRKAAAWRSRADLAATYRRVTAAWGRLADRWVNAPETTQRLKAARKRREADTLAAWEAAGYALD